MITKIPDLRQYTIQDVINFTQIISFREEDKKAIIEFLQTMITILKTEKGAK